MATLLLEDKISIAMRIIEKEIDGCDKIGADMNDDYCSITENLDWAFRKVLPKTAAYHGVSKMAIVIPESHYVIKVPFNGKWDTYYDDDNDAYEECWEDFMYANPENYSFDYCRDELDKYERAVSAGLGIFFAETLFYGYTRGGYPLYLQEKVRPDSHLRRADTPKAKENSFTVVKSKREKDYNWKRLPEEWLAMAIDKYGLKLVERFIDFINNEEPEISDDLHGGNYGYRYDGSPVLLDFSGWRD